MCQFNKVFKNLIIKQIIPFILELSNGIFTNATTIVKFLQILFNLIL